MVGVKRFVVAAVALVAVVAAGSTPTPASGRLANDLWLAPLGPQTGGKPLFAAAVSDLAHGQAARALTVFSTATADPVLGGYALLYAGRAQMALGKWDEAAAAAQQLLGREPAGYLGDAALWLAADAAENRGDWPTSVESLRTLTSSRPIAPERVWLRLGQAADRAGDQSLAGLAFSKVYYDYPLTPEADDAAPKAARLTSPISRTIAERRRLDLTRAQQLFGAHRYTDARKGFDALRAGAAGEERAHLQLRLAECDVYLRHYAIAHAALRPLTTQASTEQAEATVFYAATLRETGRGDDYVAYARQFADSGDGAWVEEALNDLATYYLKRDAPAAAAVVFAEMYQRFPTGADAERAAWRSGWWAYRNGNFGDAIRVFESAATSLGRVDRRPSFFYWAARAHAQRGEREAAAEGFRQVVADYRNSYYGRLAQRDLEALGTTVRAAGPSDAAADGRDLPPAIAGGTPPPNAEIIRRLLTAGLYDAAVGELRKAQVESGTSPLIEATIAYALNRKGDLRPAITAMRRAYPQFIAEGGEALPAEMLAVIFPVTYWDLIGEQAGVRKLDPYLMAALIAQESTFDAGARSAANAYGLMQILPSTGRQIAKAVGIRPFTTARLTDPATNIRIGMAYFSGLVDRFGDVTLALAAYNAGEQRVSRWMAERPGAGREEFVDDIPFQETQNYVKRIMGTAEDYRALYRLK
jgi:soluble lytic murein transglycosylase